MKTKPSFLLLAAFGFCLFISGTAPAQKKIIVLVRHSEKDASVANNPDPDLSAEGRERAQRLVKLVNKYRTSEIFSTNYKRTRQTAEPLAKKRNKEIQTYDPAKAAEMVTQMLASKTGRFLVVGHSNTIPALANLLAKKEVFRNLLDTEYGVFWVVRLNKGVMTKVEVFPY